MKSKPITQLPASVRVCALVDGFILHDASLPRQPNDKRCEQPDRVQWQALFDERSIRFVEVREPGEYLVSFLHRNQLSGRAVEGGKALGSTTPLVLKGGLAISDEFLSESAITDSLPIDMQPGSEPMIIEDGIYSISLYKPGRGDKWPKRCNVPPSIELETLFDNQYTFIPCLLVLLSIPLMFFTLIWIPPMLWLKWIAPVLIASVSVVVIGGLFRKFCISRGWWTKEKRVMPDIVVVLDGEFP